MPGWNASRVISLFRRETSGGGFVPEIDGLRFFAIASVLVLHIHNLILERNPLADHPGVSSLWISQIADQGWFGVPLFFVISGFILGLPFAQQRLLNGKRVNLKQYFLRRITRIEPPYVINILLFAALIMVVKHPPLKEIGAHLLASLLYIHNFVYHEGSTINAVAWSLEVEVQFYILAPLLTLVFCIRSTPRRRLLLAAAILAFGLLRSFIPGDLRHGRSLVHQMQYFAAGFLLAEMYLLDWSRPSLRPWLWDLTALTSWTALLAVLLYTADLQHGQSLHVVGPWLILLIYCAAFRGRLWPAIVRSSPVFLIGGMCYTIYLWHPVIASVVSRFVIPHAIGSNFTLNWLIQQTLMLALVIAGCSVLFLLFEKPFMKRHWPSVWLATMRGRPSPIPNHSSIATPNLSSPSNLSAAPADPIQPVR